MREWDPEAQHDPEEVEPVDAPDQAIVVQVLAVLTSLLHPHVLEEPADVGVEEPLHRAPVPLAVPDVRRVRVTLLIGERVVLPVVGDPLRDRPLHRHAAEDGEGRLQHGACLEALVGEEAVEADRRAERAQHVHPDEKQEIDPVEGDAPEEPDRREQAERRHDDGDERHDPADPARRGAHRAHRGGALLAGQFGHSEGSYPKGERFTLLPAAMPLRYLARRG